MAGSPAGRWPITRSTGTTSVAAWAGASLGAQLRVVDDDGAPLGPDQAGLLEVKPGQLGPAADWMRTTDMARIDADGFLWILGRADQAIIRGGFKVMPDDVRTALESHPAVRGAAVVGRPDDRLGETPVAMVELRDATRRRRRWSNSCERGWRATRFPPTSRSSTRSPGHRPARPTSVRSKSSSAIPSNMPSDSLTVGDVLRRQARDRAEHPLLVCDTERLSYAEADRRSAQLARGLIALGAGKGSHVGVLYPNGAACVVAMLAAARIGAVVIPFSTFATAPELAVQLADSDTEILLAASSFRSHDYRTRLADSKDAAPLLRHVLIDYEPDETVDTALLEAMEDDVEESDPVAIVYTSGSTSAPKGVVHTHTSLLEHQRVLNEIRGLTSEDKLFCNSPFFWIGGIAFAVLATLLAGSTLVCSNAIDAGETLDLLEAEKPTMTNGFVAGIAHLARHPSLSRRDLSSMRRGNLYPIMAPDVRPADPELRHTMLGMTEAGSVITISEDESDQPEHRRGSFGRPVPGP